MTAPTLDISWVFTVFFPILGKVFVSDEEDFLEAATGVLRSIMDKLASLREPQVSNVLNLRSKISRKRWLLPNRLRWNNRASNNFLIRDDWGRVSRKRRLYPRMRLLSVTPSKKSGKNRRSAKKSAGKLAGQRTNAREKAVNVHCVYYISISTWYVRNCHTKKMLDGGQLMFQLCFFVVYNSWTRDHIVSFHGWGVMWSCQGQAD